MRSLVFLKLVAAACALAAVVVGFPTSSEAQPIGTPPPGTPPAISAPAPAPELKRYVFTLKQVPPSRVWCQFVADATAVVVFDPAALEQNMSAAVQTTATEVHCYSNPAPKSVTFEKTTATLDLAWQFEGGPIDVSTTSTVKADVFQLIANTDEQKIVVQKNAAGDSTAKVEVLGIGSGPALALDALILSLEERPAQIGEQRLFGDEASAVLKDTLQLLAEIALERAKSKGARLLEQQLQKLLCEELRYVIEAHRLEPARTATIEQTTSDRGKALLPRLCAFARDVPLVEMVESAPKLARALELDLLELGFELGSARLKARLNTVETEQWRRVAPVVERLRAATVRLLEDGQFTSNGAQALVLDLAHYLAEAKSDAPVICDLRVAFAVAAVCQTRPGGCQASDVVAIVRKPEDHLALDCKPARERLDMTPLVLRVLDILNASDQVSTRMQSRSAVLLALDVAEHLLTDLDEGGSEVLGHLKALTLALFDEDTRSAVTHGFALVRLSVTKCADNSGDCAASNNLLAGVEKLSPIVVTLTSNTTSLRREMEEPERREALREARKKTLEAVIDAATQRAHRGDDWIVSAGANVGARYGMFWESEDDSGTLSLPMGIAVQYLPAGEHFDVGFHSQVAFADLAQFLGAPGDINSEAAERSDIEWSDFVVLGLQAGVALGTAENVFSVGADVRYFPSGRMQNEWFVGGFASYYVPFFDLN